jgi:hypothetical protein
MDVSVSMILLHIFGTTIPPSLPFIVVVFVPGCSGGSRTKDGSHIHRGWTKIVVAFPK